MVPDTSLFPRSPITPPPEGNAAAPEARGANKPGIRTHALLTVTMAFAIALVTGASLWLIRQQLRTQVTIEFSQEVEHSVIAFRRLQDERLAALERESALLAALPTLKALMTSGDALTIQDGASAFWYLSGTDLLMLAEPDGRVVAIYARHQPAYANLEAGMRALLASPRKHYLIDGGSLYACALRPLYFGSDQDGTLLGYVLIGVSIERTVRQISQAAGIEAAFVSQGQIVASTLAPEASARLAALPATLARSSRGPGAVTVGRDEYLSATEDLSSAATAPLQLVVLKSFAPAERSISGIDHKVLIAGLLALLAGTLLMVIVGRLLTRPLRELSRGVRAFGLGDAGYRLPRRGTREVRQLSAAFSRVRDEILVANRKLLESERLATIGRMASSVSHDLRHYLAAIFANAEFLASDRFSSRERAEIFGDIRAAVEGTTDMIDSLLIFSRTGAATPRQLTAIGPLLDRTCAMIRTHPEAQGVTIAAAGVPAPDVTAWVAPKQIERALSNLLLNACQACQPVRAQGASARVEVSLAATPSHIVIQIRDNGAGVSDAIRQSLFEPFVSAGKPNGTGLGLTLARRIAIEHGGEVALVSGGHANTVFQMTIARAPAAGAGARTEDVPLDEVNAYALLRT